LVGKGLDPYDAKVRLLGGWLDLTVMEARDTRFKDNQLDKAV
jgi:hypothetical protein